MDTKLHTFRAIALLTGTVIGAGVLGIPYIMAQSGFLTGLLVLVVLGLLVLLLNLLYGEVILRTTGNHQLTGYVERYLGKKAKALALFSLFFGIYGALIAYIIGEGLALSSIFGLNPFVLSICFFIFVSYIVYRGLNVISKYELYFLGAVLFLVLVISGIALFSGDFNPVNLYIFNIKSLLIPFGVILFAFRGLESIPEMKEYLTRDRKKLKKAIIWGSLIPLFIYIIFAFSTVGVTGEATTDIATIGLGERLGESILLFGNLFAIFAMLTSFLTLALAMKEIYIFDYKIKPLPAWALTVFIPIIPFLFGLNDFITVIAVTGAISAGLEGILIVLMYWKSKKKGNRTPEYSLGKMKIWGIILMIVFLLGILSQVFEIF